jgi:hypothetical protein
MPAPTPLPRRRAIWRRHRRGETATASAQALGLPPRTVRQLVHHGRRRSDPALAAAYPHGGRVRADTVPRLQDRALALRREHPPWGAGFIRVLRGRQACAASLPTERTLQRWFRGAGLGPAPQGPRPAAAPARARQPPEVWQVDAKERVRLRSGQPLSWLRVVAECRGAVLWTAVFPPRALAEGAAGRRAGPVAAGLWPVGTARHPPG